MPEQSSSHKKKMAREPRSNAKKVYKKQSPKNSRGIQSKIAANQIDLTQQDKGGDANAISAYTKKSENTNKSSKKNGTPAEQASPEIPAIG